MKEEQLKFILWVVEHIIAVWSDDGLYRIPCSDISKSKKGWLYTIRHLINSPDQTRSMRNMDNLRNFLNHILTYKNMIYVHTNGVSKFIQIPHSFKIK